MNEPLANFEPDQKGSLVVFFKNNQNVINQIIALGLLSMLLVPFFSTALVAVIFFSGIHEAIRVVSKLPFAKKIIFYILLFFGITCVFYLFYWFGLKISESPLVLTNDSARQELAQHFNSFFNDHIISFESWIIRLAPSLDQLKIHDLFMQGIQNLIKLSFNLLLTFFRSLPMFFLQICFFMTVIFWLVHTQKKEFDYYGGLFSQMTSKSGLAKLGSLAQRAGFQTLISTCLVSLVQAGILGLTGLFLGLAGWPIIFFTAFIFSFFPVIGTLPAAFLGIILAYNYGGTIPTIVFTGAAVITSLVDNFLRAWLMALDDSITPNSFNFFAIIGGIALFGFAGVLIGPFFLAFSTLIFKENKLSFFGMNKEASIV
jgi:predicted PurR-regulated permease PerM